MRKTNAAKIAAAKREVSAAASAMSKAHWEKVSADDRSAILKAVRAHGGGRQRSEDRCYCGQRSRHSAELRRFDCCKRAGKFPEDAKSKRA